MRVEAIISPSCSTSIKAPFIKAASSLVAGTASDRATVVETDAIASVFSIEAVSGTALATSTILVADTLTSVFSIMAASSAEAEVSATAASPIVGDFFTTFSTFPRK